MNERDLSVLEDARMLASGAAWSIELQIRRLKSGCCEVESCVMQPFVDFHYLLIAVGRLEKAAKLAGHVIDISAELKKFKSQLPWLAKLRNAMEHIDDYQLGHGRDSSVLIRDLHVFACDNESIDWLGVNVEYKTVVGAASSSLECIQVEWERITCQSTRTHN